MGIKRGDIIATITNNRPEWNFIDMGIAQIGAIHLPIFTTLDTDGYRHILRHAQPRIIVISGTALLTKISPVRSEINNLIDIFSIDETSGAKNWKEIVQMGLEQKDTFSKELERIKSTRITGYISI